MKLTLVLIASLFVVKTFAGTCEIQGHGAVKTTNGEVYTSQKVAQTKFRRKTNSWEACYELALEKSEGFVSSTGATLTSRSIFHSTRSVNTNLYIYFSWNYDGETWRGFLDNESGKITKYTKRNETSPITGDVRYTASGSLW